MKKSPHQVKRLEQVSRGRECSRIWLNSDGIRRLGYPIASLSQPERLPPGQVVAESRTSRTTRHNPSGSEQAIYVKKYWYPTFRDRRKGFFRATFFGRPRARREWEALVHLQNAGLGAPTPLAYGETRSWGLLKQCFLVTEGIPGPPISDWLQQKRTPGEVGDAIRVFAASLKKLHDAGIQPCQLRLRNILITEVQGAFGIHYLDLPRTKVSSNGPIPWKKRIPELADLELSSRIVLSPPRRMRFLHHYAPELAVHPARFRSMLREVARIASRRGRPQDDSRL